MVRVFSQVAVPYLSCETGKIRLFWRSAHSRRGSCCPIENHEISEAPMFPHRGPQDGEEPDKTMAPTMKMREITQQKMHKQTGPYLPADSIFVIAEKVCQLQSLLDLLEKHLDIPSATIQFGDAPCAPFDVVGQKRQLGRLAVDLNDRHNSAQHIRIRLLGLNPRKTDQLITQNAGVMGRLKNSDHLVLHIPFRSRDPEYPTFGKFPQMRKVQISLVKYDDFSGFQVGAQLPSLRVVMMFGRVNNGETGQETLKVKPQMTFRRRLTPPMLSPVHTVGHKLYGCRIQHVNSPLESFRVTPPARPFGKGRIHFCQMLMHQPIQVFRHLRISNLVGVTQCVAAWRRRTPDCRQRPAVHLQRVADIVQSNRVRQMSLHPRNHMALRIESSPLH